MVGVFILIQGSLGISYLISSILEDTVLTSLSPLPEQLITISLFSFRDGHNFSSQANACAVSKAGIIPSSSLTSFNAVKASRSVTAPYSARPISFRKLCSGPTPG